MNYFYTNGTPVINSLKVTSEVPLDPRLNVENIAERDSLVTNHIAYDRMCVYIRSTDTWYIYHQDTREWEIDNKFSEDDKVKLDNITNYLIDTEHIYNPENNLIFREHSYTPFTDITVLRDHILQEARVTDNGELYNGLLSKFYVNRLNNVTNYLTNISFTKATDVADLYLTTHSYNPDTKVLTKTNINIPVATDANNGLLSNIQNIKLNRIIDYMTEFSSYTNDSRGLKYTYKKYNPNTNVTTSHDVIIPLVTHTLNGLLSSTDKIKIDDIETYVKSVALRQAFGTEELGIDYVITNPNTQTDTPGFFNLPLVTDSRNGLVSPARKHWMDNANGVSNTGTTSDTWQLKKKDIDTKTDPNGGIILKSSGENLEVRTKTDTGYANIVMNDITIKGNVTQEGDTFITEAERVEIKDNTILLNRGETGAGVTAGFAGIEIDRGTLPKFQILFNESDRRFKAGEEGDLWCLALRDNDADMIDGMFTSWDATTKRLKTTNTVPLGKSILFDATMDAYKFNIRNLGNTLFRIETPSVSNAYIDLKFVNKATFATGMAGFQFEKPVYFAGNIAGYSSTLVFSVDNTLTSKLTIDKDKATFSIPVYGTTFYRNSDSSEVLYHADIVNNLTTGGVNKVLSAEQGKALKKITDDINTDLSTNYLPLTAGSGKALTGMLYATKGVRIPRGECIYTSSIAGTDTPSLIRISSSTNYNLSIGVQTATSNEIELVADYIVGTPNDKARTNIGTSSKRFGDVYATIGDFTTSVTSLLLKSTGNAEVSKTLTVGDNIQMANQTAVKIYNGTKYANALWGNDDILTVGQEYPYISIGINNGTNFATFNKDSATLNGYLSVSSYITTPSYISATQGFKVQSNRVTSLNRPKVVNMSSEVVSFPAATTGIPGTDPVGSGLGVNDGFCTTYFWDGDFAVQLALDIDGTGVAYRHYTPSTGVSSKGWNFLATTAWTNGQLTDIRGKYLPLTGGTLSGDLIFNNSVYMQWKNTSGTALAQMYLNDNNVLVIGNVSNAQLYFRTDAVDIVHERAGATYSVWDAYNLSQPARLDATQTFTGTNTFSNLITASKGVQIGTTADYGWYFTSTGNRISAGVSAAKGVNVGSLLVSSAWADYTKVPTNGIYVKGVVYSDSRISGTSFSHPTKIDWTPELAPDKTNNALLQILDNSTSTGAPTSYGTVLQVNSRISHWATQLYIDQTNNNDAAGKIRYRTSKYNSTEYSPFKILATEDWTTSNFAKYAGGTTLYQRNLGINGNQWTFMSHVNSATTSVYAPTTAGTSGQILQSTGGVPAWIDSKVTINSAGSAVDVNTLPNMKFYYSELQNTVNGPAANGNIISAQGNDEGLQLWGSSNKTDFYIRTKWTSFGSWYKLATTVDLAKYLPLTGGTLTGNLTAPTFIGNLTGRASRLGEAQYYEGYVAAYRNTGSSTGGILIKLPFSATSGRMVQFTIRMYANYDICNLVCSGYLYNSNGGYIYTPRVIMTAGNKSKTVIMGRDASNNCYVFIEGPNNYAGVAVTDVTIGFSGGDWSSGWVISPSVSGAEITAQDFNSVIYPPATTSNLSNYLPLTGGKLTGSTANVLQIDRSGGTETYLQIQRGGTAKSAVGYLDAQGPYIYNYDAAKYMFVKSDGVYWGTSTSINRLAFLSDIPSVSGYLTQSAADARYLKLAGGQMTGKLSLGNTSGLQIRNGNDTYLSGIFADTNGNECVAIWAKSTITRLRWNAGVDMSAGTAGLMMGITPDFEISKASGSAIGYIAGNIIATQTWVSSNCLLKTKFNSSNSDGAVDCNTIGVNGVYYYTTNGPTTAQGASTADGALFTQQYSDAWKGQIAQDYRNGNLFVRGKNNGTWTAWTEIATQAWVTGKGYITSYTNNYITSIAGGNEGLVTVARSGLANITGTIYSLAGRYTSGGKETPNSFGRGLYLQMLGASNIGTSGSYADVLILNSYISDVPNCNALAFSKDGSARGWIVAQNPNNTSWGTKNEIITTGNISSYAATTTWVNTQLAGYIPTSGTSTISTKIVVGGATRNAGMIGTYDSAKTQQIWAMGTSYLSSADGSNFGSLYGLAYKHTNNTTGGTMAGGHQMVWCTNGTPTCALGTNIWTSGTVSGTRFISSQATGTAPFSIASTTVNTNLNADMVDGQHFTYSNSSNSPTYLWATNSNGTNFLASRTSITVGYATQVGDGSIYVVPNNSNEINIGGSNANTTIYVGYRATGSRPIPTNFVFGGSSGSATITAASFTGNAATATTATKWNGYDIWVGTAADLPASRVATTLYFVKA